MNLDEVPVGSVIEYRKEFYWVSEGLDAPILTDKTGHWYFIKELNWKKFKVVFSPVSDM